MNQQHCQQLVHTILYTDHPSIHELVHTVMWDPSTDEIYPEDIYQENAHIVLASLQSQPMADPSPLTALIVIVNHAEARDAPDRFHFRLTLTRFLIACAQPQAPHLSWALSCLSHHCPYLFTKTNNHDVENMQQELFTLCLRLRSLNGVKDIEVYHLLYNILRDLKLPCEARQAGVRQTKESRFYQSLALCDSLLDNCVDCPSDYRKWVSAFAKEIPPSLVSDSISIQLQFQLYNTLYKNELAAFLRELTNLGIVDLSNTIQLSSVFTEVIQSIPKSILSMLDCYVERRASAYKSPVEVEHLPYFEKLMEGITSSPPNIVQLTRECGLALSVSQARLITPITICLTHIMRAAMKYETEETFNLLLDLCSASWSCAFTSLLEQAFYNEDSSFRGFGKAAVCFELFSSVINVDYPVNFRDEVTKIWEHYEKLWRLRSPQEDQFQSTTAPLFRMIYESLFALEETYD